MTSGMHIETERDLTESLHQLCQWYLTSNFILPEVSKHFDDLSRQIFDASDARRKTRYLCCSYMVL